MLPCPFLPSPDRCYTHEDIHALGSDRGPRFYDAVLRYAQSLWLSGFPAKSLLLLSRALACRLPDVSLSGPAAPYSAVAWLLRHRMEGQFIGNPRWHYQHLATRMVEPHRELRRWRAWACWYISKQILPEAEFPPDMRQVREEGIVKPRRADIAGQLTRLSPADDLAAWESALGWVSGSVAPGVAGDAITLAQVGPNEAGEVSRLAHLIWPQAYSRIISREQVQYMLQRMYDPGVLRADMAKDELHYALIRDSARNIGYLAWEAIGSNASAFLHKLYLLPEYHGLGLGARALRWVEDQAAAQGLERIRLRVNRNNSRAIRSYLRAGFVFEGDLCTDIGGGFTMDDFIMVRTLA